MGEAIAGLGDRRIHAIVGPRQAGKTTMLLQLAARMMGDGCDPRRIVYASLAVPPLSLGAGQVRRALEWYVREVAREAPGGVGGGRLYFLLDEVQDVDGWQGALCRWAGPEYDARFFVSASSDMGERGCASGPLAGRMRRQHVMLLSFSEYASLGGIDAAGRAGAGMRGALAEALAGGDAGLLYDAARSACARLAPHVDALGACLSEYLAYGGRPGVAMERDRDRKMAMLADSLHLAVYGDIVRIGGGAGSPALLDSILSVLAWESPRTVSVSGLARDLDADRETVRHCLRLLEAAHIVYGARLYSDDPGAGARLEAGAHMRSGDAHGRDAIGGHRHPRRSVRGGARGRLDRMRPHAAPCLVARCGGGRREADALLEERQQRRRGGGRRRPDRQERAAGGVGGTPDAHT